MKNKTARIQKAQNEINRYRALDNQVAAFATFEWENGFLTMAEEDFKKLSKAKKNKLMKSQGGTI